MKRWWSLLATLIMMAAGMGSAAAQEPALGAAAGLRVAAVAAPAAQQETALYEQATDAFDRGDYATALSLFRQLVDSGGPRADAALYWIAYAHSKNGDPAAALEAVGELRSGYPDSAWLDDADYLEAEIRGAAGQTVEPDHSADEEMRLYALNSLMNARPERAVPMLRRILEGDESPEMKSRALFVLVQSGSDAAFDLVTELARGATDPDLRLKALRQLGLFDNQRSAAVMEEVYASTDDVAVKGAILQGYMMAGDTERLSQAARNESDEKLRIAAIRGLATSGGTDEIWDLYQAETSLAAKKAILQTMFMTGDASRLIQIARSDSEPELRAAALQGLAMVSDDDGEHGEQIRELLLEVYASGDPELRRRALQVLWMRGDASTLISLYEKETNRDMRTRIVRALSMMDSDEAVEFLIRIIEQ